MAALRTGFRLIILAWFVAVCGGSSAVGQASDSHTTVHVPSTAVRFVVETTDEVAERVAAGPPSRDGPKLVGANLPAPRFSDELSGPAAEPQAFDPRTPSVRVSTLLDDFAGLDYGDSGAVPPDTEGAAGPQHLVSCLNGAIGFFDKSTGAVTFLADLADFLAVPLGLTDVAFDPKVIYDPRSGRFFAIAVNMEAHVACYCLLAVSDDSDPHGTWYKYAINVGGSFGTILDYPDLGVDQDAIYVTGNMYYYAQFLYAKIWVVPKPQLLAGNPSLSWTEFADLDAFTLRPCVTYGSPGRELVVEHYTYNSLRVWEITDASSSPSLAVRGTITVPSGFSAPNAPQLGSAMLIETPDTRLMNALYQNEALWCTHTVNVGGRAANRWYEVDARTLTLLQSGDIADPVRHYYYPSIHVNDAGSAVIGFSGSSPSEYVGGYYTVRLASDPPGFTEPPALLKAGEATYERTDTSGRVRWGDYSRVVVDPTDDEVFWTIQEYAKLPADTWGTWWGKIGVTELLPGDFDGDGDVDLDDFGSFAACYNGSARPPADTCPPGVDADLDGDGDVDLDDFAIFAANYTGSL